MRQSAYPEIGQRITISQGKGAAAQACFAQEGASRAPWVLSGNFTRAPSCFQWVGTPFSSMFWEQFRQTLADIGEQLFIDPATSLVQPPQKAKAVLGLSKIEHGLGSFSKLGQRAGGVGLAEQPRGVCKTKEGWRLVFHVSS